VPVDDTGPTDASMDLATLLPDPIVVVDADAQVVWGNRAAERMFDRRLEDSVGFPALELVHPDDVGLALVCMESIQGRDAGSPIELRVRAADGWRLVELVGASMGERVALTLRDLTVRRRWEIANGDDDLFRSVLQNAAAVMVLLDAEWRIVATTAAVTRAYGWDPEALEGVPFATLLAPDSGDAVEVLADSFASGQLLESLDAELCRSDGSTSPVTLHASNLLEDPTVHGVVLTIHDVARRVDAEAQLHAANSLLSATLDATAEGVLVLDRDGHVTLCNQRFVEMWNLGAEFDSVPAEHRSLRHIVGRLRDPEEFLARVIELQRNPDAESHDVVEFADGRVLERDSRPRRLAGDIVGRVWSFRDITAHRMLQQELARQASHDPLTGLANTSLFRERLARALARAGGGDPRVAVLFIDLDDFKTINDSLGHSVGDELLMGVAERLRGCVRTLDAVARMGGDEFAVLVSDLRTADDAAEIARRILAVVSEPLPVGSRTVVTTASVGIAVAGPGDVVDDVLRNADAAMYAAKGAGRNRADEFRPELHAAALRRLEIDSQLRGAAARGELVVHYQPVVDLASGEVESLEALVRWNHPEEGLVAPGEFIPIAENSDLIDEIGAHVLHRACLEAASWPTQPGRVDRPALAVNLAPRQLQDVGVVDRVRAHLQSTGLPAGRLTLEITESALTLDPATAQRRLEELKELGVRLAMDDFGTGYSSLSHLQRFPIDVLKIDRSFVSTITDGVGEALIRAVLDLSHALGIETVAEGVETEEQRSVLVALGCRHGQGHLFSRPVDGATTIRMLELAAGRSGGGRDGAGSRDRVVPVGN
jgi:diguanylate cyclase (GGDEF)-like protein/PAS domain S-box-containing protein